MEQWHQLGRLRFIDALVLAELYHLPNRLSRTLPHLDITYAGKLLEASKNVLGTILEWKTRSSNQRSIPQKVSFVV
jgi:hypothetical protein